ncbi:MAG: L,D-transpeptidase family protein [Bdellovibrionales bacterium]
MFLYGMVALLIAGATLLYSYDKWYATPMAKPQEGQIRITHIVVRKARREMQLYNGKTIIRSYAIALGKGGLEPKTKEGDNKTPEGNYTIVSRNPRSAFHLALRISYPNDEDKKRAAQAGYNPGSDIMIHGLRNGFGWLGALHRRNDWTAGCIAVTNKEIEEIWSLVPDGTPIEIK